MCGVFGTCVLSWLQKEDVCKLDHILYFFELFVVRGGCDRGNVAEDLEWGRFDTVIRGVLLGVGPVLELQAYFQLPLTIYPQLLGPHCSGHLANGADSVLHLAGSIVLTAGTDVATVVLVGKGSEDRDIVLV